MIVGFIAPLILGPSGYANACRNILFGLADHGVTVRLYCQNVPAFDGIIAREEYQRLKVFARETQEPDIFLNISPQCYFSRVSHTYTVGLTMWEGLGHPARFKSACQAVDELWVPGLHDFYCFQEFSQVPQEKIALMPFGVDIEKFTPEGTRFNIESADGDQFDFIFGIICGYSARKGVDLLERAFLSHFTKGENVALLIKGDSFGVRLLGPDLVEAQRNLQPDTLPTILYHFDPLTDKEMPRLQRSIDCLVFPSRGEGQGLPPLEAMSSARPVIMTAVTGLADFAFPEVCFPIPSTGWETDARAFWITGEYKETKFATPDYAVLCKWMRYVHENRGIAEEQGRLAREFVLRNRSTSTLVKRMIRRLAQILNGEKLTTVFGPESLELDCPNIAYDATNKGFVYRK